MSWTPRDGIWMDENYKLVYPDTARHLDDADAELMKFVDVHWTTFPPQHPFIASFVAIAYIILFVINILGNGSVIYIFLKVHF